MASWNQGITDRLLQGAIDRLQEMEVTEITVLRVPGALELPVAVKTLIGHGCDAAIAIGTVVKGDTDHYEIVVRESAAGIALVALESGIPVGNAILAVHEYRQALERSGRASQQGRGGSGSCGAKRNGPSGVLKRPTSGS